MFTRVPGVWSVKQSTWFCPIKVIFLSKKKHISDNYPSLTLILSSSLFMVNHTRHTLRRSYFLANYIKWIKFSNYHLFQGLNFPKLTRLEQYWLRVTSDKSIFRRRGHQKEKSGTHSDAWTGWHVRPVNHRQSPYAHNCRGGFWTSTHQISTDRNGSPEVDTTWSKSCHPGLATSIANTYFLATSNQTDKCSFLLKQR